MLLSAENISKSYIDDSGYRIQLFKDVTLSVDKKEIISVVAPTGSGKSSIVKTLAGIDSTDEGSIKRNGKTVFIPGDASSFPWLNVEDNIKFAEPKIAKDKLTELISFVGLEGYEKHHPANKSYGFRFRISLARALAVEPEIILIDEPFTKIHEKYRIGLYDLVLKVKKEIGVSVLLATTNVTEAIYLSDRIYLLSKHPGVVFDEIKIDYSAEREHRFLFDDYLKSKRDEIENIFHDKSLNIISDFNI